MASNDITVRFGADVGQLQAGVRDAGASVDGFRAKVDGLKSALAAPGFKPLEANVQTLRAQFDSFGAATAAITAQARAGVVSFEDFNPIMGQLKASFESAAEGSSHLSLSTAGARRELVVMAHEMATGNYSRLGGSLMVLAERMGGLSGPAMAASAALAGLGFAAYELVSHLEEAETALDHIQLTMANMGRGEGFNRDVFKGVIADISEMSGLSKTDSASVIASFQGMTLASDNTRRSLERIAPIMAVLGGQDADKMAGALANAFSSAGGIQHLATKLGLFSLAEQQAFEAAQQTGNLLKAQEIAVRALAERYDTAARYAREFNDSTAAGRFLHGGKVTDRGGDTVTPETGPMPDQGAVQRWQQDQKTLVSETRQTFADIAATWTEGRTKLAEMEVATWAAVIDSDRLGGKQLLAADSALEQARAHLRQAQAADAGREERGRVARMEAAGAMGRSQILAAEIASNRRLLAADQMNADERRQLEIDTDTKIAQLAAEGAREKLRALQEAASATKSGSEERIAAESEVYAFTVKTWGDYSAQAKAAQDAVTAAVRERVAQTEAIEKAHQQTEQEIARMGVEAEKERLGAEVELGQITTRQKIAALRQLTDATYEENLRQLDAEDGTLVQGTAQYEEALKRRAVLAAQYQRDTQQLALQDAQVQKQAADRTAQAWDNAFAPMSRGFDMMVQGVMMGTQTIQQAVARAGLNMVASYGEDIAKMLAQYGAFEVAQLMGWTQMATGLRNQINTGTMAWLTGEQTKTAATETGNTARAASDAAGQSTFLGRLGTLIAGWLGLETGKTAETVTGNAARAASDTAAVVPSVAAAKAEAAGIIPAETATAAMGAAAAVAATPVAGPALAAQAAAAMTIMGAGYLSMASAAGGWAQVPYDGALAELHKDEMVLPAAIATPLRAMTSSMSFAVPGSMMAPGGPSFSTPSAPGGSGAGTAAAGGNVTFHVSAIDAASVQAFFNANARQLAATIGRYSGLNPGSASAPEL